MSAVERPSHLLLLDHPLSDKRNYRRLGKFRSDAKPGPAALSIVNDRTAVGTDEGQELRTKAAKPCDREFTFPLRLPETDQELLQVADRPIDATVPQTPLHGRDVPVNGKQDIGAVSVERQR